MQRATRRVIKQSKHQTVCAACARLECRIPRKDRATYRLSCQRWASGPSCLPTSFSQTPFKFKKEGRAKGLAAARTPWWYPFGCDLLALAAFECLGGEPLVAAAAAGLGDAVACRLVVATAIPAAALRMPTDPRHLRSRTARQRVTSACLSVSRGREACSHISEEGAVGHGGRPHVSVVALHAFEDRARDRRPIRKVAAIVVCERHGQTGGRTHS